MRPVRDMSISRKLKLVIMVTSSVALLVACVAFITYDYISARRSMASDLSALAKIIGTNSTAAIAFDDRESAKDVLSALSAEHDIVAAQLYSNEGVLVAEYRRDGQLDIEFAQALTGTMFRNDQLLAAEPIVLDQETIGRVYLTSDLNALRHRVKQYVGVMVVVLLASLLIAFLISSRLQRMISEPISHLARTARAVSTQKDYTIRARKHGRDETGILIDSFNEMLSQIQERDSELQAARDELERRVEARTRELQDEVAVRKQAEQASRESGERYQLLFESNPQPMWVYDLETLSFLAVNDAAIRHYGYSREEFVAMTIRDIRPPEDVPLLLDKISQLNWESDLMASSWRHRKKDGTIIDVEIAAHTLDFSGRPAELVLATDVTERKQAEHALRESEAVFRSLAETVSAAIYIYRDSKFIYLNPAAETITGYSRDELMGMELWDILHPDFQEPMKARSALRQQGETVPSRSEVKILTKNGEERWLDLTASLIQFKGQPAVLATAFNITERKGWEEALRESEEKYRTILQSIQEGYYEVDLIGNFTFMNDSLCRIVGSSREKLLGVNNREYTDAETGRKLGAAFRQVYNSGEPLEDLQYQILTRSGVPHFLETSVLPQRDSAGKISGFRGTVRDITERKRSEEALKSSEAELRALFEAITDVIIVFDAQGCYRKIVPTNSASLHKPPNDVIGKTPHELFPKDKADFLVEQIRRALQEGRTQRVEYSLPLGDTEVWFDGTVSPLSEDSVIWIARDITERKQAEQALRASEEQYRMLFERNLAGVYRANLDGRLLGCNEAAARILGYDSTEEALSHSLWDFYYDPAERQQLIERLSEEHSITNLEARCRSKKGDMVWVLANVSLLDCASGSPREIEGTLIDITARKQAEREVVMLAHAIRGIHESVTITDNDEVALFVNDAFLKTYGYDRDEVMGRRVPDLVRVAGDSPNSTDVVPPGKLLSRWEGELFNRRKDGTEFPIHLSASPIRNDAGEKIALVGVIQDITEQRRAIAELQNAKEAAEAASRAKSEFLANMSHEIRTPMNGIIGMTELTLDTELTSEQREYLKLVKLSSDSLLRVINDILDFSKIEAGKLELELEEFSLQDSVDEVMKALAVRADQKALELAYYLRPGVPDLIVGDGGRLRQILVNLVGNAIKFTERGEVVVRIDIESQTDDQVVLHFCVRDTGIGVPIGKQEVIFESFTQADGSTTRKYGGTGLGLAISGQLVRAMSGQIWIESPAKFELPKAPGGAEDSPLDLPSARRDAATGGPGSMFHFTAAFGVAENSAERAAPLEISTLRGLPVLVVDDNATNRRILEVQLTGWGMKPATTEGATEALDAIRHAAAANAPFKLVLADLHMPDVDGGELTELIRRMPEAADVRIIMMSSALRENYGKQDLGVDAYLLKPVKASQLLGVIRSVLGKASVPQNGSKRTRATSSAHPARVLVAEDSAVNQELIKRLLAKWGHSVVIAENGKQALSLMETERFDVVLMDVQMPEINGFEATASIRESERATGRHIPIIALTAHALKGDRERCIAAGMDDYISKPIESQTLFDVIESAIAGAVMPKTNGQSREPAFDAAALMRNFDDDVELVRTLAGVFAESSDRQLSEIRNGIASVDCSMVELASHSLKGAVANFRARATADAAASLEQMGRAGDLSNANPAFEILEKELQLLQRELSMFVEVNV
jgi:two-component system, sensor histidine kinase and response regulator